MKPRVCLHMIVKNESPVIARCLRSVLPWVDAAVIVDTGSADDTRGIASYELRESGKKFVVAEREWKGFAASRNDGLALARETIGDLDGWLLFTLDADEILTPDDGFAWPDEDLDGWHVWCDLAGVRFTRTLITRASVPWKYEGALHEDVTLDREYRVGHPPAGLLVRSTRDGARARNPKRYEEDAALLLAEHEKHPEDARTVFYIANSYRDAGNHEEALRWYDKRAAMPGTEQETWATMHERARCMIMCKLPANDIIAAHLLAYQNRPCRAETLRQLAQFCRMSAAPAVADLFDDAASRMRKPRDIMFVDQTAYTPSPRVGIITAPRAGGAFPLAATLTGCIAADDSIQPEAIRVFNDGLAPLPLPSVVGQEGNTEDGLALIATGGIFGTLNLCRALEWAAGAEYVSCVLEDDVLFARDWMLRATALLEEAERHTNQPIVLNLHHMHGRLDGVLDDTGLRSGNDRLLQAGKGAFANGSQGLVCRPATAMLLASELRERAALPTVDERKDWAMDVGLWKCCHVLEVARMVYSHPCLLWHQDSAPSTWATKDPRWLNDDAAHQQQRKTRHFWPW